MLDNSDRAWLGPIFMACAASCLDERKRTFTELTSVENRVYRVDASSRTWVLRLSSTERRTAQEIAAELAWLRLLDAHSVPVVRTITPVALGPFELTDGKTYYATLFDWVSGENLQGSLLGSGDLRMWGRLLGAIHSCTRHLSDLPSLAGRRVWRDTSNYDIDRWTRDLPILVRHQMRCILSDAESCPEPRRLVHGDLGLANIRRAADRWIALDFDDACYAPCSYDIAAVLFDLCLDNRGSLAISATDAFNAFMDGYESYESSTIAGPQDLYTWWWALLCERVISSRRLGVPDRVADDRLITALANAQLPPELPLRL